MELLPGIEAKGKALWMPKQRLLAIADLHLGYERALQEEGLLIPKTQFNEIIDELKQLLKLKPKTIVINGDLKHEFGEISRQEWDEVQALLELLLSKARVVLVKGNHDTILGPLAKRKALRIRNCYKVRNVCFLHGHKVIPLPDQNINTLVIAHDHPSISLREGPKQEQYKCWLLGEWKRKKLLIMPSFFSLYEGSDIRREQLLSPYLQQVKLEEFKIFIVADKVYEFGKLKQL